MDQIELFQISLTRSEAKALDVVMILGTAVAARSPVATAAFLIARTVLADAGDATLESLAKKMNALAEAVH